jgi:hypothetical protein
MGNPEPIESDDVRLKRALKSLEDVREKLTRVNEQMGYMTRYNAMRREIEELGWDGICSLYHPDINMDDPAAYELFQYYKFVYENMSRV